jgi:nucleotide-binding universal stress UspA family protein
MFSMSRILLPVDFSRKSLGPARVAEALAEHYGAKLTMLHVLPPPHYEFATFEAGGLAVGDYIGGQRAAVQSELDKFLTAELPQMRAERVLLEGDPAHRIVEFAHANSDLIVMPTHGYGPFRRFILGSVTAKVLHDAHIPVLTGIHMDEAPEPARIHFGTVMVALDLGKESEKALRWAIEFAGTQKARLLIAHVTPSLEGRAGEYFDPNWRQYLAEQALKRINDLKSTAGTTAEVVIEAGDVPYSVHEMAERHKADALVIARGSVAGRFGRLRANAYAIIRQSPCLVFSV